MPATTPPATAKGIVTGADATPAAITIAPDVSAPAAAPELIATAVLLTLESLLLVTCLDNSLPTKPHETALFKDIMPSF
ncbi:hypothetical protein [Pseudoalteromonas sp. S3776]|uniref:hypothetical protein n=1 Tax=Pseudoalteromonas sp. S3776 TaxID=579544 RepID=UPI0014861A34|nr:hypothetical protein [Pseudoalteromonas sp. S3776]